VSKALVKRMLAPLTAERRYGLDTRGRIEVDELGYSDSDQYHYEATAWRYLPVALPKRSVTSKDVLVDLGSGKGRVLFEAARRYPFKRVIGVEFSERLNEVARANIERNRRRLRCQNVEIVTANALEWDPPEDLTIVYLHNPFAGELLSGVITRLVEFAERRGRPLHLVYVNPVEHARVMQVRGVKQLPLPRRGVAARIARIRDGEIRRYTLGPESERDTT
jgi:SAM-dependent methyltransferase